MIRELLFYSFSAIMILASLYLLFSKNPVKAAFAMFVVFFFTGLIYIILGLHFIGAVQIIIYAGAIMSLFIVALPAMSNVEDEQKKEEGIKTKSLFSYAIAFMLLATLIPLSLNSYRVVNPQSFNIKDFAMVLFSKYWLQIEIISMILLAAVAAAYMFLSVREEAK